MLTLLKVRDLKATGIVKETHTTWCLHLPAKHKQNPKNKVFCLSDRANAILEKLRKVK
jgi:hypothetical protein